MLIRPHLLKDMKSEIRLILKPADQIPKQSSTYVVQQLSIYFNEFFFGSNH